MQYVRVEHKKHGSDSVSFNHVSVREAIPASKSKSIERQEAADDSTARHPQRRRTKAVSVISSAHSEAQEDGFAALRHAVASCQEASQQLRQHRKEEGESGAQEAIRSGRYFTNAYQHSEQSHTDRSNGRNGSNDSQHQILREDRHSIFEMENPNGLEDLERSWLSQLDDNDEHASPSTQAIEFKG